ncbi:MULTISPECIES: phytanoyl-CoA dioxygenase family protein [unclassified Mycobacterium]|uniref:phytanoyl-CoA dioxygenase family protein n=1 Tax=unclassified Mycobacterium TaxID=2642494 RepID=UPI00073FDE81|nr:MULTISPECIES: phytanoyl-CoA dioxygenase family protein [unclassified Mycobacterium]KUH87607.1 mitomycin antibiotics/polyketide fumonisin biosynthesis protein [Mycobacterium sp. GA-1999]KUH90215.1 mitomycin antibiotics/polyketide fumonisin biosynthesis protein [Mycobacterium sp. IS-1556]KUH90884.1 mitomycin antibiotics/polyketide fumonisin biosynthesis protein [Mycobacterium sp. GA-0227b]
MVDLGAFLCDGFVKLERAAPRGVADAARGALWQQLGLSPDEPDNWAEPVYWAGDMTGAGPFGELARSPTLAAALDRICGAGGWSPRGSLGNIPVRFPVSPPADDRGWHIDANTPRPDGTWTVTGRPHTVLVLTLLSDVGPDDAPTRIRVGSHRDVAHVLGPEPVELAEMGRIVDAASAARPVIHATGEPGDMYVLHPFTVHAADEHRGTKPRFMAQSPVVLTSPLTPASSSALARVWDT